MSALWNTVCYKYETISNTNLFRQSHNNQVKRYMYWLIAVGCILIALCVGLTVRLVEHKYFYSFTLLQIATRGMYIWLGETVIHIKAILILSRRVCLWNIVYASWLHLREYSISETHLIQLWYVVLFLLSCAIQVAHRVRAGCLCVFKFITCSTLSLS